MMISSISLARPKPMNRQIIAVTSKAWVYCAINESVT